jgi:hypothetical protein
MNSINSLIDGSLAIGEMIAALAATGWAMMASESTTTIDMKHADEALRSTMKKAA